VRVELSSFIKIAHHLLNGEAFLFVKVNVGAEVELRLVILLGICFLGEVVESIMRGGDRGLMPPRNRSPSIRGAFTSEETLPFLSCPVRARLRVHGP
jgi:hypothetical protein